ncbi:MAG: UDP-glucuronic acid decarboxylase family protein [Actinomycetota bacterium]
MRILLTGAAGFIGSHLAATLLADGHEVIGVDNLRTGQPENLEMLAQFDRFTALKHDVSEPLFIDGGVDAVLHLASPASPVDFERIPIPILKANAVGAWHTLGIARAKGARYLLASTSETYGDPLVHPQPESYWGNVNPVGIRGVYDEAKRFAEAMTMAYHRTHGLDTRIARIFNTYGPRMRPDDGRVVPAFIGAALAGEPLKVNGDGTQTRSFCFVDDLVDGLVRLLHHDRTREVHGPVNLGSDDEHQVRALAELIISLAGSDSTIETAQLPADDPKQRRPDISRARGLLGWIPTTSLEDGLVATIQSYR